MQCELSSSLGAHRHDIQWCNECSSVSLISCEDSLSWSAVAAAATTSTECCCASLQCVLHCTGVWTTASRLSQLLRRSHSAYTCYHSTLITHTLLLRFLLILCGTTCPTAPLPHLQRDPCYTSNSPLPHLQQPPATPPTCPNTTLSCCVPHTYCILKRL